MVSKRLMRRCSHRRTDAAGVPRLPYRVPGLCPVGVIDSCGGRQHAPAMQTVHATTVALDGTGVLLRGPAGSGKSDLALRLIDQGARLVADDRTALALEEIGRAHV